MCFLGGTGGREEWEGVGCLGVDLKGRLGEVGIVSGLHIVGRYGMCVKRVDIIYFDLVVALVPVVVVREISDCHSLADFWSIRLRICTYTRPTTLTQLFGFLSKTSGNKTGVHTAVSSKIKCIHDFLRKVSTPCLPRTQQCDCD